MKGKPVQVVDTKNHKLTLNTKELESLLLDPEVKDKKIVVLSVTGDFNKGKSFLLGIFLHYLQAENKEDWLKHNGSKIEGFKWNNTPDRETTGIVMWSQPFVVTLPNSEEVVVILMDTQGTFDGLSSEKVTISVFGLSVLLSSVQIYNLMRQIQDNDLQHLQYFSAYANCVNDQADGNIGDETSKPFQLLQVVVRDWNWPSKCSYGIEGGNKTLKAWLEEPTAKHLESQRLIRQGIQNTFNEVRGCLLPFPGEKITDEKFDGILTDLKPEFLEHVKNLVESLLKPENLQIKKIAGKEITCAEFCEYIESYVKIYQSDTLPKAMTLYQATSEIANMKALMKAKELYKQNMDKVFGDGQPYLTPEEAQEREKMIQNEVLVTTSFQGRSRNSYQVCLAEYMEIYYQKCLKHNDNKNTAKTWGSGGSVVGFIGGGGLVPALGLVEVATAGEIAAVAAVGAIGGAAVIGILALGIGYVIKSYNAEEVRNLQDKASSISPRDDGRGGGDDDDGGGGDGDGNDDNHGDHLDTDSASAERGGRNEDSLTNEQRSSKMIESVHDKHQTSSREQSQPLSAAASSLDTTEIEHAGLRKRKRNKSGDDDGDHGDHHNMDSASAGVDGNNEDSLGDVTKEQRSSKPIESVHDKHKASSREQSQPVSAAISSLDPTGTEHAGLRKRRLNVTDDEPSEGLGDKEEPHVSQSLFQ